MRPAHPISVLPLLPLLLLGACDRGSAPPPSGAPATPTDTPTPAAEPEPEPTPAPVASEPYRRAGDSASGVDDFVFWGWSEDARYYAFETFHNGSDMVNCEGEAELAIVDAQTNHYAKDGHVLVEHAQPEAEVCDPPDLREALAVRRPPLLAKYGISAGHIGGPISLEPAGEDGEHWSFTPPGKDSVAVSFRVLHGVEDPMEAAEGAAFELVVGPPGASEPGSRRRPWTLSYGLEQGMVFVGPDARRWAIMVAQRMTMPEGVRTSWTPSGLLEP